MSRGSSETSKASPARPSNREDSQVRRDMNNLRCDSWACPQSARSKSAGGTPWRPPGPGTTKS
eukprot:9107476-Lingulodinium_polyedra.AAC.1